MSTMTRKEVFESLYVLFVHSYKVLIENEKKKDVQFSKHENAIYESRDGK